MALLLLTLAFALAMVVVEASARAEVALSYSVKGSVLCVDCHPNYDYTGTRVTVTCDPAKSPVIAIAKTDGSFEAKLSLNPQSLANCQARLLGGPKQLYAKQASMVSKLVKSNTDTYTTSTALAFASACSTLTKSRKCGAELGSSKTVDLPIPPEYGMPPTRYYIPVLPIIGIP